MLQQQYGELEKMGIGDGYYRDIANTLTTENLIQGERITHEINRNTTHIVDRNLAQSENENLQQQLKKLKEENQYYRDLLTKPMLEIAGKNQAFKETYEKQQEFIADWMVSQKAFKELAIKYGIKDGKTKEEILDEGLKTERNVLENTTEFDNNVGNSVLIGPYVEKLKEKLKN